MINENDLNKFDMTSVVERMRLLRVQKGITQNQIAEWLDVSSAYISNVENAKTRLNLRILLYYAQLLDVSVDYLLDTHDSHDSVDYQILNLLKHYNPSQKEVLHEFLKNFPK